jgi:prepilin-type N-terminal cleavage/methylation domain-containing protein
MTDRSEQAQCRRGFTLIEVILAMAISMMVIAGISWLFITIIGTWMAHKAGDIELQHMHSKLAFLDNELSIEPSRPTSGDDEIDRSVQWRGVPGEELYSAVNWLSWGRASPPVFFKQGDWKDDMGTRMYLRYDRRRGISIVWHPDDARIERLDIQGFDVEDYIYEFPLISDVQQLEYGYYDSERDLWEFETATASTNSEDNPPIPDAISITLFQSEDTPVYIYIAKDAEQGGNAEVVPSPNLGNPDSGNPNRGDGIQ